jgi:type II secretory pathway component PulL
MPADGKKIFVVPGAEGWNLISGEEGPWRVRAFATLEEAAQTLDSESDVVLALPISAVLAQRMRLPSAEGEDLREMVRIQLEKSLPFPAEEVTSDFEVIEQVNGECVISAVAVQNDRLRELAAPLLNRNVIPRVVTVYAAQRLASHPGDGCALFIYPEAGALVSAISENRKLSFARTIDNGNGDGAALELELPQLALSAELQGIDASFQNVLLDEKYHALRETVQQTLDTPTEIVGIETPPAATELNLLPAQWREQRARFERRGQWRKRLLLAAGVYAGLIVLFVLQLLYYKFSAARLDRQINADAPRTASVRATVEKWRTLAPAIDPHFYPIEILRHLFDSLPSADVQITQYNQSARQISIEGEAKTAALAYQFADKLKKQAELQSFTFEMQSPRLLPNDHAQFHIEGKPR